MHYTSKITYRSIKHKLTVVLNYNSINNVKRSNKILKRFSYLGLGNFLQVAELLNVEVLEVKDQMHYLQRRFPKFYGSRISLLIRKIVLHK